MSEPTSKSDYKLHSYRRGQEKKVPPEEPQQVKNQLTAWFEGLQRRGHVKASQALCDEGRTISGKKARPVADGPFAESKEAIGGYIILQELNDLDDAVAIAKAFP